MDSALTGNVGFRSPSSRGGLSSVLQYVARRRRWLVPAALGAALLAFYWLSAATKVGGGNWGEFQTFGYQGGIAHSPGYPLLTGSIYLATRILRFLEPAHTANLVGATYAAAAGLVLFVLAWRLSDSQAIALLTTVVFATGYSTWEHATQAEMMSLQTLLVFALIAALVWYDERPSARRLALVAFVTGLSLTNHGVSLFMIPATAAFVALGRVREVVRPRNAAVAIGAFAAGLLPWLYVIRGLLVPVPINRPEDLHRLTMDEIIYLAVRRPFSWLSDIDTITSPVVDGRPAFVTEWPGFAQDVLREFGWGWLVVCVLGWVLLLRARPRLAAWIGWTGVTTIWFALSTPPLLDADRYFVVVYALLAVCLAAALAGVVRQATCLAGRLAGTRAARAASIAAVGAVLVLAGVRVLDQSLGPARVNVIRQRENAEEQSLIGEGIVRHMAPGSVYMTNWTSSWYPRYAVYVKGLNKQLEIRTTDYFGMGIEQAEEILDSGRNLYIQRSTPEYEQRYRVVERAGVFYEVLR